MKGEGRKQGKRTAGKRRRGWVSGSTIDRACCRPRAAVRE
jgi:hypothetical protein